MFAVRTYIGMMWFTGRQVMWLVCHAALPLPCELSSCSGIRRGGNRVCSSGNQQLMMWPTHWGSALLCSTAWMFCFPLRSPFVLRLWLHSACFRKKLYPIDPLLHCCIQDTVVDHVVFDHEYSRTIHVFVHILSSLALWCVSRPTYLSQPVALTAFATLSSHTVLLGRCDAADDDGNFW